MHELHFHRQKALEEDDLRHASRFCAGCFGAPGWPETVASLIPDMGYVPVRVGTLAESLDPGGALWRVCSRQTRCATHSRMAPSPNLLCGVRARTSSLAIIVT